MFNFSLSQVASHCKLVIVVGLVALFYPLSSFASNDKSIQKIYLYKGVGYDSVEEAKSAIINYVDQKYSVSADLKPLDSSDNQLNFRPFIEVGKATPHIVFNPHPIDDVFETYAESLAFFTSGGTGYGNAECGGSYIEVTNESAFTEDGWVEIGASWWNAPKQAIKYSATITAEQVVNYYNSERVCAAILGETKN